MAEVNYRNKYHALRLKFVESMDMAFRLGYEQGQKDAMVDQAAQAQQDAAAMQANENGEQPGEEGQESGQNGESGQESGQPGQEGPQPGQQAPSPSGMQSSAIPGAPQGSELDQHINTLESLVSSKDAPPEEIKKSLDAIKMFKSKVDLYNGLAKSQKAIPAIAKALKSASPKNAFRMSTVASHNLNANSKEALTKQHEIVSDVMKTWAQEEAKVAKSVSNIMAVEGLSKKE